MGLVIPITPGLDPEPVFQSPPMIDPDGYTVYLVVFRPLDREPAVGEFRC